MGRVSEKNFQTTFLTLNCILLFPYANSTDRLRIIFSVVQKRKLCLGEIRWSNLYRLNSRLVAGHRSQVMDFKGKIIEYNQYTLGRRSSKCNCHFLSPCSWCYGVFMPFSFPSSSFFFLPSLLSFLPSSSSGLVTGLVFLSCSNSTTVSLEEVAFFDVQPSSLKPVVFS